MKHIFFHFGRAERIVSIILLSLVAFGIALFAFMPEKGSKHRNAITKTDSVSSNLNKISNLTSKVLPRSTHKDTIVKTKDYAGPPDYMMTNVKSKLEKGTVLDINTADSTLLVRVPGIGPAFAGRIIRLRERLGGFYTVMQLQEVYGMDYDRFLLIKPWFCIKKEQKKTYLDELQTDELPRHPYLSWSQRGAINKILRREGKVNSWKRLMMLDEFSKDDSVRLSHYFPERKNE
ncbi:helix-hairpin-helix domain-containing protein [Porphyromonas pogonae]|uniref:ComEA family DNA-binding protein n=1 Tax=Porphyromonas pogonae TaxID=867595 RepID=UPI002E79F1E0|nr:helix-hairpin-helix domain-containing protein [Porphyromonas pogonae]